MPTNHSLHSLTLALGVALAASACGASPTTTPVTGTAPATPAPALEQPDDKQLGFDMRQYAELQQMLALGTRCEWLQPAERTAIANTAEERLAWLALWDGDTAQAEAGAREAVARSESTDCGDESGEDLRKSVLYGAWQMRITWALRAHALLDTAERPAWIKGLSQAGEYRAVLDETLQALSERYKDDIGNALSDIQIETERALASTCPESRTDCPESVESPEFAAYASTWIRLSEDYAAVLAETPDRIGEPGFLTE